MDRNGNVYVANGQIVVYNSAGRQIAPIDVPERPINILFGGADGRTLFILAHHSTFFSKDTQIMRSMMVYFYKWKNLYRYILSMLPCIECP